MNTLLGAVRMPVEMPKQADDKIILTKQEAIDILRQLDGLKRKLQEKVK